VGIENVAGIPKGRGEMRKSRGREKSNLTD
jgi:hypothetical protein